MGGKFLSTEQTYWVVKSPSRLDTSTPGLAKVVYAPPGDITFSVYGPSGAAIDSFGTAGNLDFQVNSPVTGVFRIAATIAYPFAVGRNTVVAFGTTLSDGYSSEFDYFDIGGSYSQLCGDAQSSATNALSASTNALSASNNATLAATSSAAAALSAGTAATQATTAANNTAGLAGGQPLSTAILSTNTGVGNLATALIASIPTPELAPMFTPNTADQMALIYWLLGGLKRTFDPVTGQIDLDLSTIPLLPASRVYFQTYSDVAGLVPATSLGEVIVQGPWVVVP